LINNTDLSSNKETLEIIGKIEKKDPSIEAALKRELQEECNLFLDNNTAHLIIQNPITLQIKRIFFPQYSLISETPDYLSPGFSTSKQYPYILYPDTKSKDFIKELSNNQLISQESNLSLYICLLENN